MMQYKDLHSEILKLGWEEAVRSISPTILYDLFRPLGEYYNKNLSFPSILNYFTDSGISDFDEEQQVKCVLPGHGTEDRNKSARYYKTDRYTGLIDPKVYCYKCDKTVRAFNFLHIYHREFKTFTKINEFFIYLKKRWGVDFPLDLVMNYKLGMHVVKSSEQGFSKVDLSKFYKEVFSKLGPVFERDKAEFNKLAKGVLVNG